MNNDPISDNQETEKGKMFMKSVFHTQSNETQQVTLVKCTILRCLGVPRVCHTFQPLKGLYREISPGEMASTREIKAYQFEQFTPNSGFKIEYLYPPDTSLKQLNQINADRRASNS